MDAQGHTAAPESFTTLLSRQNLRCSGGFCEPQLFNAILHCAGLFEMGQDPSAESWACACAHIALNDVSARGTC